MRSMMPIKHSKPPAELLAAVHALKSTPDARLSWGGLDAVAHNAALQSLLDDQGNLCAYCMRRINIGNAHVEHYIPQSDGRGRDDADSVRYGNMFAVCDGFVGGSAGLTCDRARGNKELKVNPAESDTLATIRYRRDGSIAAGSDYVERDLVDTLNLNQRLLVRNRQEVIKRVEQKLNSIGSSRGSSAVRKYCDRYVKQHVTNASERQEYDGAIVYFMKRRLRR